MREKGRVRGYGQGSSDARRDYRDSLFSVFVENLNPIVDVDGLWGIFKPFGRVRDIFKSQRSGSQRSCYAFIRFATVEEARRVAVSANGIHIYGWPIIAKEAKFG
ncbi:hypothetical protein Dsin_016361 [Dipteronia sinensis]|uniref:RRM domain-containing protein n=1 Tax=Dipteronia sinensis TaxID=43782 RepID=A0AAE0E5X6_9ROSI|nr:hypothetical protein Dsin_016361 [Dipteronia sinensis]